MIILGIESTAHTFGIGIVSDDEKRFILADKRAVYTPTSGGIHPRESSRYLASKALRLLKKLLKKPL